MSFLGWIRSAFTRRPAVARASLHEVPPRRLRASYEAAQTDRHWQNFYATAYNTSANAELTLATRKVIRKRCRQELRNNPWARGMVDAKANYVVGTGPRIQLLRADGDVIDGDVANAIEALWQSWCLSVHYDELLRVALVQRYGETGEAFILMTSSGPEPVTLWPVVIEADRITDTDGRAATEDHEDGVDYDGVGRPVRYSILDAHPGDIYGGSSASHAYDAGLVHHIYRPIRPGQRRGIPDITPALPAFGYLRSYNLAVLASAETAAKLTIVLTRNPQADALAGLSGDQTPAALVDAFEAYEIERGMVTALPEGWNAQGFSSAQPTQSHDSLVKLVIGECARCLQMPWSIALGTSQDMNYSYGRLDSQAFVREVEIERARIEQHEVRQTFAAWLKEAILALDLPIGEDVEYDVVWDGFYHVDPMKEAAADNLRLANGMQTLSAYFAKQGLDWERQIEQMARERKKLADLGLTFANQASAPMPSDSGDENAQGEDSSAEQASADAEPGEPEEAGTPADATLTGVQIQAAMEVIRRFAAGEMTSISAVQLLVMVGITRSEAEAMIDAESNREPTPEEREPTDQPATTENEVTNDREGDVDDPATDTPSGQEQ